MRTPRGGQIDDLEQREFSRARKGYEPSEVRATLVQTAAELRRLRAERGRLSDELAAARAETERVRRQAESAPVVLPDDAELTRVLGEEMVKLLDDARTTAAGIAERAEEAAQGARSAAEAEAAERLEGLDEELAERRAEAEADEREILERANNVLAERTELADEAAAELKAQAEAELAEARQAAREHIEAGKDEGRRLVVEAKTFRERILRDLAGRRKLARKQLESMRAAQERLLGAFTACAVAVESATGELHTALPEAKMAADDAAKRVTDDIEDVVVAMEAAIATGELPAVVLGEIGRPDLSGRTALTSAALPVRHDEAELPSGVAEAADDDGTIEPQDESDGVEASANEDDIDHPTGAEDSAGSADDAETDGTANGEPLDEVTTGEHPMVGSELEWTSLDVADLLDESDGAEMSAAESPSAPTGREHLRLVAGSTPPPAESDEEPNSAEPAASDAEAAGGVGRAADAVQTDGGAVAVVDDPADIEGAVGDIADIEVGDTVEDAADAEAGGDLDGQLTGDDDEVDPLEAFEPADDESSSIVDAEEADEILDHRDDAIGPIERGVSRRVKRLVDDEQNELLDALRRSRRNITVSGLLPDTDEQVGALMELLGADLTDAVAAGAASVAARSGTPVALGRANLERLAGQLETAIAARLVNPWRDEVATMISAEPDRGQLSERLRSAYRERKTVALPELASGVVVVAYNVGVAAAAKPGPGLDWVLDHGGEPAEAHLARIRGGDPAGLIEVLSAPEVPVGCRCMLVTRPG
jgi:ElaB/YqjD/DUF883 family membrane-anchored ribosome-binding protein